MTDLTCVATWSGIVYVCFIVDAFSRMIVGWRVATHMRTEMVLDALEMARWSQGTVLEGLVCHSDAGRSSPRSATANGSPSSVPCPRLDRSATATTALAESVHGLYKTELIRRRGPWRTVDDVELATLGWVHWFNNERPHGTLKPKNSGA